ncbi:MAG: hypothetical protein ACLU37_02705 [Collinsella sp.]
MAGKPQTLATTWHSDLGAVMVAPAHRIPPAPRAHRYASLLEGRITKVTLACGTPSPTPTAYGTDRALVAGILARHRRREYHRPSTAREQGLIITLTSGRRRLHPPQHRRYRDGRRHGATAQVRAESGGGRCTAASTASASTSVRIHRSSWRTRTSRRARRAYEPARLRTRNIAFCRTYRTEVGGQPLRL